MELSKWDKLFMDIALRVAEESKSTRLKVGAVAVKDNHVLVVSFNGTVSKYGDESLEDENGVTTPETLHAEENLICQAAIHGISLVGATVYCNYNSCRHCASLLGQVKIAEFKYLNEYRDQIGIDKLKQYGVKVTKLNYEVSVD